MSNTKTPKLTTTRTPSQPIRLEPGEAVHVGVDVHKASGPSVAGDARWGSRSMAEHRVMSEAFLT